MSEPCYKPYKVWDPLLRALHWWNAVTLLTQISLGTFIALLPEKIPHEFEESLITTHALVGYLFGAGLFTRVIWLFIGPPAARWKDMLPVTKKQRKTFLDTIKFYAGFLKGKAPLYKAHNPVAGIIYALFFIIASVQVVTGALTFNLADELREKSVFLEFHEVFYLLIVFYIIAHVFAVAVHEIVERHGLISAMFHGNKGFTEEEWESLKED